MIMSDIAIRLDQNVPRPPASVEMGVVICDVCSARFGINQEAHHESMGAAERQATWLERRLIHDHENGLEHENTIDLPGYSRP